MKDLILKYALQNAVLHEGKAEQNAVLGRVLGSEPSMRTRIDEVKKEVAKTVQEVNGMAPEEQRKRLERIAPELLEKEVKKHDELPPLRNAEDGHVVTRFAPSPTGPLSIFHVLRAVYLNYLYAKRYNGQFILRIEDTDADKIKPEYYEWIKEDLLSVGVKWDKLFMQSDHMELYYKYGEKLIQKGDIYACFCDQEKFKKLKLKKMNCPCRDGKDTLKEWQKALKGGYDEGQVVFRLKTSMKEPNPVLRDPPLFRINKNRHPLKGTQYKVWPLYNFANVIDDHETGVTHVFRGKEHEHNTSVQKLIYDKLGWEMPDVINFGMISLPGVNLHTRDVKRLIAEGQYSGWDDPRLPTVRALIRKGYQPDAFKELSVSCGLTKTDINVSWEKLETLNRRIIDPRADRYMVVLDPVRLIIKDSPKMNIVHESRHPDFPEKGKKTMPFNSSEVYISREDYEALKGKDFRLKGLGNINLVGKTGRYLDNAIYKDMQKVQWVSVPNISVRVIKGGLRLDGLGEQEMHKLRPGDLIQMERTGFARVDSKSPKEITLVFAHK